MGHLNDLKAVFRTGVPMGAALALGFGWAGDPADGLGPPLNLRCEYQSDPLGLDVAHPRLSWHVNDDRRGATQAAYQIVVAATREDLLTSQNLLWDTGRIESDQSVHVEYQGPTLESGKRYYWRVRTWDQHGQPSSYSEPAFWEMGLLAPEDWSARWIAVREKPEQTPVTVGQWIWHPERQGKKGKVFFRAKFDLNEGATVTAATIKMTVDNAFTLYLNGQEVGSGKRWESFSRYDVTQVLQTGRNVVAVEAVNVEGHCGLVFGMRVDIKDGQRIELVSNDQWLTSTEAQDDWAAPDYDDSQWAHAAVLGDYGAEPWGRIEERAPSYSVCLRKEFQTRPAIARARAYVSGLGLYELRVNSQRVGADALTPGWTHYFKRVQYQTYDVTAMLRDGDNAVGAVLGNGWWGQGMAGRWKDGPLRFICQLDVEYEDGTCQTVITDDTWKGNPSPIVEDSIYNGETYDARLELPGWDSPGVDDGAWLPTQVLDSPVDLLVAQRSPTIQVTEELQAVSVAEVSDGVYVYDYGQNAVGWARLKVSGPRGTRVQIRFAEVLKSDGGIYTENLRGARATDVYVLKGEGVEVWEPRFTYHGFRYAEISGYPGVPAKDALVACVAHSAAPVIGAFRCSHDLINRIERNITWGQRSNMHSVPTDCPQRDERLGWMGDAQAFAPTACWNREMAPFFTKWMGDITDSQGEDGHVTDFAPAVDRKAASPGWGDAVSIIPWTVYRFYGDTRIIEENYDAMAAWVEFMGRQAPEHLYEREGYSDWVAVVPSPKKPIGAAYYFYSTRLLAEMAQAVGKTDDAQQYGALADRITSAFNAAYLDDTGNYPGGTQTANILPLYFGITPTDKREPVFDNLVGDIVSRDYHLSTGFLGTAYLMPLLSSMGGHDVAWRLAAQTSYPSWGYTVEHGATTIWERWNSDRIDEVGPGMNSFNHFAFGSVGQWFYESLAGISPDSAQPGFKHIIIRPRPVAELKSVSAEYQSMYGRIQSAWDVEGEQFRSRVAIPANTTGTLFLPATDPDDVTEKGAPAAQVEGVKFLRVEDGCAVYSVGSGTYDFAVQPYRNQG